MPRNTSQLSRLFCWRYLRWALAVPALPLALWACNSHPLQQPQPSKQQETDFEVNIAPQRAIDILFMIDNSPSMEQEQANLAKNFKTMIDVLKGLPNGLPDVHLAVVDSDIGAGNIVCNNSQPSGDWGLLWGNPDPSADKGNFANVTTRPTSPDANGCGLQKGARWIEDIGNGKQKNYTGDISSVFGCLANVGTEGCGFEHQLQAVRVALTGQPINQGFLRDNAYLAIVLVTDEDDCSAEQSTNMFSIGGLSTESASLRCATRGHICNGQPIPYYDVNKGFNPPDPSADVGFETEFKGCAPRTDNDLPLIQVQTFIDEIKKAKPRPDEQIIVAGIFGWPLDGDMDSAKYKIGKDPNPDMDSMKDLWDYLPICQSAGLGKAYGGLRLNAFVNAFKGQVFSICQGDFQKAMNDIGKAITKKLIPGCLNYYLMDADGDPSNGVQAECHVIQRVPTNDSKHPYEETSVPQCDSSGTLPCWDVAEDKTACTATGLKIDVKQAPGTQLVPDTLMQMKCLTCPDASDPVLCPH